MRDYLSRLSRLGLSLEPRLQTQEWMREEVTQNYCHKTMRQLFIDCKAFIDSINQDPGQVVKRLWPKFDLDPEFEKLLVSN